MILVAFVLVLVATVMLIIGTFFDGGVAYIWISIAACVATFGVLAASYFARRRGADDQGARPQPLGAGESRPAAARPAPRGTTVGAGGPATATRERTEAEAEADTVAATGDEPTVTIVPPADEEATDEVAEAPAATGVTADTEEIEQVEAPTATGAAEPAPRRVAPRRVVRRTSAPAAQATDTTDTTATTDTTETADGTDAPTWPSRDDDETQEAEAPAAPAAASSTPQVVRRAEGGMTRKVVRRAAPGTGTTATRKVVRRAPDGSGTRVVRRAGGAEAGVTGGQRTVKRVVRRAPASSGAGGEQEPAQRKSPDRSGTRGKRARAVLSEIKGVGPAKQDALLKRFGSLEAMAEASVGDLAAVKGVGESVATAIKKTLKDR